MDIYICEVVSVSDKDSGGRIQARVMPVDRHKKDSELPYAFPLLPKMMHVLPKVNESVIIITMGNARSQRFYIGPIISQPQFMEHDDFVAGATTLLKGGIKNPETSLNNVAESIGAMPQEDDIALIGRKNSDIILSDSDIKVRCGSRVTRDGKVYFNTECPSFIKLKYYEKPLDTKKLEHDKTQSVATVVADKIALLSPNGDGGVRITNNGEVVDDKEMERILEGMHMLPYGDELVKFLTLFLKMFKSHTHKYDNLPPCPDSESLLFGRAYGDNGKDIANKILSKDIGIN